MLERNSTNHVFRFLQLRAAVSPEADDVVVLMAGTPTATRLAASPSMRQRLSDARGELPAATGALRVVLGSRDAQEVVTAMRAVLKSDGTVGDLRRAVSSSAYRGDDAGSSNEGTKPMEALSDFLLVAKMAGTAAAADVDAARDLFIAMHALKTDAPAILGRKLSAVLERPLLLPRELSSTAATTPSRRAEYARTDEARPASGDLPLRIQEAVAELVSVSIAERISQRVNVPPEATPDRLPANRHRACRERDGRGEESARASGARTDRADVHYRTGNAEGTRNRARDRRGRFQ